MTVCRIVYHGDSILYRMCEPVAAVDDSVRKIVQDLVDTLYSATGVGLAAPQIGVNKRVFIYDPFRSGDERNYKVLLNPRITHCEGTTTSAGEGCKSAPDLRVDVERSAIIDIEGMDETGAPVVFRAEGFEAIVLQHEMDHLEGKLITHQLAPEECASYERRLANIVRRQREPWYVSNLEKIRKRLRSVALQPEGVLFSQRKANYQVFVVKDGSQVQLYFSESRSDVKDINVSGIMSRVDIDSPLNLLGIYTQAMMLSLLWKAEPRRVYVLGFGGGRLPMVLYHYYPELVLESTEIDPTVVTLAKRYFGIELDNRMQVFVMDGREYLMKLSSDDRYDIMLVDCYTGSGAHPYSVSTMEFYELCKSHLAEDGVVASNLVRSDPMFREKMHTFVSSFSHAWRFELGGADVFFGSGIELSMAEMFGKADELYERFSFVFPFRGLVKNLRPIKSEETSLGPNLLLSDSTFRNQLGEGVSLDDPIFYGAKRNDLCPCGSGKKFKRCHGR